MTVKRKSRAKTLFWRGVVEIGSILFLFYANLLMGEYERSSPAGKTLMAGLSDIWTYKNFGIGLFTAILGFVVFESLREKAAE